MEITSVVKAGGMSIGGAGVVGATGYGVYTLVQPTTIGDKLEWEGLKLIDSEDTNTWKEMAKNYPNKDGDSSKKLPNTETLSKPTDAEKGTELKDKCANVLKIKLNSSDYSEEKFDAAKVWCAKSKTVVSPG